ncbi:MAG TPA: DUF2092 domain-containing protein [Candidatus Sulfotelmatobacter sp.]|nr:DUF2092 domain-containing protein [Candidatus Sulfotelmatobacter sp.]
MFKRWFCSILIVGFSLSLAAQSSPAPKKVDRDPDAIAALNKMGTYLRTLATFQVKSVQTTDDVLENGQAIQSNGVIDVIAVLTNRLRAEITSDDKHQFLFYDGKNFTIFGQLVNYYATVPAPPTIGELIDKLDEKYGIEMPLVDLFLWSSPQSDSTKDIIGAIDVGPSSIEGTSCEQYAFRQAGLDWQIWIQLGDYPLPRKLILTTTDDAARPRHSQVLTWNLAPSFNDAAFTFEPPDGAQKIVIAEVGAYGNDQTEPKTGSSK